MEKRERNGEGRKGGKTKVDEGRARSEKIYQIERNEGEGTKRKENWEEIERRKK